MIYKIKTSKKTQEIFTNIDNSISYPPYILAKLAISMSIKTNKPLEPNDFKTDNLGLELNRQTITGEWDDLYKCLIEMFEGRNIDDNEYLQKYLKAHLDRGAKLIFSEFKYNNDFILGLLFNEKNI